ncbi:TPA: TetR family transcriptional regulator [Kluyvera ascorbata]|uniref:TetR/AcrR family transcriptional regulator n=1 Tax=Kluyvera ascorbata TaxID=51288 RepID=UPI002804C05D|nr:TetR family transcriptional regulator [Kluyvera ascorbata]MDU3910167.1 TetR family transcriptional regulator [Kluyvera ascorbata]HDG1661522.1 TetR family transcriptional regulator [Kluyvera ascorbata]HDG1703331.1 TetR family transcriptional regulator [Kluyvera ascorbata]HDG1720119.1 TetR family transcriptional regulator [Kluyvera ascorbata]
MSKDTETYHKLITAAAACFAEKGFSATSVREISTRAGISQGAMYTYFKGKDELIRAIVLEEQNSALSAHKEAAPGTYFERLCQQVASCISDVGYPVTHRLWVEIMAESSRNAELQDAFIASDAIMRQSLATIIEQGMAAGEFRPDINPQEMTIILFAFIDGLIARKAINSAFSLRVDVPMFPELMAKLLC